MSDREWIIEVVPATYAAGARAFLSWSFARAADGETTSATDIIARDALVDAKSAAQIAAMQRPLSQRIYAVASKWLRDRGMIDDVGYTFYQGGPHWLRLNEEGEATPDPEWTAARVAEQEATRDGMLAFDADFADLLEGFHPLTAERYRSGARRRWNDGARAAWAHWAWPIEPGSAIYPKALLALGIALWRGEVKSARDGFQPNGIQQSSGLYAGMGKPVAAVSWAFGVPGEPIEVDGESYGATPRRALVPRVRGIVATGLPAERTLGLEPMTDTPLALQIAGGAASEPAINPLASKIAFLASVLCYRPGTGLDYSREGTLGDLAKALFPDGRRIQKRDLQRVAAAVGELDALMVLYHDNTVERLFQNRWPIEPRNVTADAVTRLTFGEGIRRATQAPTKATWMRGDVLVNVSRALELENRGTGALRLYLAAASRWNDDNMPSGARKPVTTADEWARAVNQLPTAKPDRRRMREIRERVFAFADELSDKGLAKVTAGAKGKLIIEPTDEHLEAYGKRRKSGAQ